MFTFWCRYNIHTVGIWTLSTDGFRPGNCYRYTGSFSLPRWKKKQSVHIYLLLIYGFLTRFPTRFLTWFLTQFLTRFPTRFLTRFLTRFPTRFLTRKIGILECSNRMRQNQLLSQSLKFTYLLFCLNVLLKTSFIPSEWTSTQFRPQSVQIWKSFKRNLIKQILRPLKIWLCF